MPGGDRTGPMGMGPRTGRAAGWCAGFPGPGYMNPTPGWGAGWGYGRGRGFGFRRGWGRGFRGFRGGHGGWGMPGWGWGAPAPYAPAYGYGAPYPETAAEEIEELRAQAKHLESALDSIRQRIEQIEASGPSEEEG
jgi:hypothetical protein